MLRRVLLQSFAGERQFRWTHNQDEIQWRFEDGAAASLLARFQTPDYFIAIARVLGQPGQGAAISGLVRMRQAPPLS